jgi:hypothetical protein
VASLLLWQQVSLVVASEFVNDGAVTVDGRTRYTLPDTPISDRRTSKYIMKLAAFYRLTAPSKIDLLCDPILPRLAKNGI